MEHVQGLIDRDPAGVPGRPLGRLRNRLGMPAPAPVHGRDGHHARGRRASHHRAERGSLEHRPVGQQERFQRLAEVLDEVKAIDHLDSLGGSLTNAIRIEVTPITADSLDRRMLRQPGRDARGRAVRQQVHDAMRRQINQNGAVAMAPPPGPLVDADGLQSRDMAHRSRPHQPEQGGRAGREPQTSGEPGARLSAQGQADRPQDSHQPMGAASGWRNEVWKALREDPARAGRIPAHELPHGELDADRAHAPRGGQRGGAGNGCAPRTIGRHNRGSGHEASSPSTGAARYPVPR
jgi:hypothetical protein